MTVLVSIGCAGKGKGFVKSGLVKDRRGLKKA